MYGGTLLPVTTPELIAHIAGRLEAEIDTTVADMVSVIVENDPVLGADAALVAEVRASCLANVRRFVTVARRSADPPPPDAPLEALDVARTLVRRGIDTDVMYQAYRRGQQVLWRHWMTTAERHATSAAELATILDRSLELLFVYVDDVLGRVIAEMQRERQEVLDGTLARRAETIHLLLDGAPLDLRIASRRLGHELSRHHTAVVIWAESSTAASAALETAALTLTRAAGGRQPLMFSAGSTLLWAWIGTDGPCDLRDARVEAGVRIAVGPALPGATGFRSSHEAALTVQRLMIGNPEAGVLSTYEELEVTALASQDPQRAHHFVAARLGPLAEETPIAARLRETLRIYLDEAENAPRAAKRLYLHRNTVLQRVARATEILGYPPARERLAVELALELRRRLGPRPD